MDSTDSPVDTWLALYTKDAVINGPESTAFVDAFSTWVEDRHPEIGITTHFGEVLIEKEPDQILALVDEFVEQSDVYPLAG